MANNIIKQPFKVIEVPLNKFTEEIIPHHQNIYEQYKVSIKKLLVLNDTIQLKKVVKQKKHNVKQLRDLMYELDTLRTQVEDENLDQFDTKTLSLRKILLNLISGYTELEKSVNIVLTQNESEKENQEPLQSTSQIQIQANVDELKLQQKQEQLVKVENINKDVEDLHEMYKNLNEIVSEQAETVDQIADIVQNTQENVNVGTKNLAKAHKLKAVAYPVTGAVLGGIIGGPIGLLAGLKVGGVAAVACAVAGYTGGKWFKKKNFDNESNQSDPIKVENKEGEIKKKDI